MATQIGVIELIAKINTSDYQKGAREIEKTNDEIEESSNTASERTGSAWASVAKLGFTVAAAAAAALTTTLVKASQASWDQVSSVQQATAMLGRYYDSAADVTGIQQDLIKYAQSDLGVLFNRKDLFAAAGNLAMYGSSVADVVKQVQILSRGMASNVLSWDELNSVIGRVISSGRLTTPEFEQLAKAGYRLDGSLRNTSITAADLFKALDNSIAKDISQDMDNIIPVGIRLETAFRGIGNAILGVNATQDGFMPGSLGERILGIQKGLTDFMNDPEVKNVAKIIGENVANAINMAISAIGVFIDKGQRLVDIVRNNQGAIKQLVTVITILLIPAIVKFGVQSTVAFAQYALGVARSVVLTTVASVRMAAAWLLALGPIGLIVAAVAAAAALIIMNWDTVKNFVVGVWNTITDAVSSAFNWVKTNWPLLLGIITGPFGLAAGLIIKNFDKVKSAVGNVWDWIKGVFSTIGSVAASVIKLPVNAIIGFAQRTINGFIRAINSMLGAINKLPGPDISRLAEINIPMLATGGIITSPTLAMVGEGNEPEAVIPLSKLDDIIQRERSQTTTSNSQITINISGTFATSRAEQRRVAEQIRDALIEAQEQRKGGSWQLA